MLLSLLTTLVLMPARPAWASSTRIAAPFQANTSNLNTPLYPQTTSFNYTGGTVTVSTCQDMACSYAIDDAAQITVTRPDNSQVVIPLPSDTKDKAAFPITSYFQVGPNVIKVEFIDHLGPYIGLPRALYLVESTTPLPLPNPPVQTFAPAQSRPGSQYASLTVDPVDTFSGSFTYEHMDVAITGRGPTPQFFRNYLSSDTIVGAMGPGWKHNYEARLVRADTTTQDVVHVGPQGRADRYTRNADGSYTPPQGVFGVLVKNAEGTYTVKEKDQSSSVFDETGRLLRIIDRFGNQSVLSYDGSRLANVSDPAGRGRLMFGYNANGLLSTVTDWANRVVTYGYDSSSRLQTVTDRESKVTTFAYDGTTQRITTITDALSHIVVTNTYDTQGRVATQKDSRGLTTGQLTSFSYGAGVTTVTYPKTSFDTNWNFTVVDTYDAQGRIITHVSKPTATSSEWITEQYGYDASGNRNSVTDGRGNTTTFCYDVDYAGLAIAGSRGNLTRQISPAPMSGGNVLVSLFKYDSKNNLTQSVPPKGVASGTSATCSTNFSASSTSLYADNFTYDTTTQTMLVSGSHSYTDPSLGQLTATVKYEYNDAVNPGQPTRVISARGNTTGTPDYAYATTNTYVATGSKAGLLDYVVAPNGAKTSYDYDSLGRLNAVVDPNGNVSGANAADHTSNFAYDNEDRVRLAKAPAPVAGQAQLVTETRYDAVGNKTSVIDANGQVTRYVYDERDSLKEVHQNPNAWTDPAVNPAGLIITGYQYDHLGFMTRTTRAQGDATNERVTDYVSDGLGRVRKETQYPSWPTTTPTLLTQYTYDQNGNRLTVTDPLNKTTTFVYDRINRLTNINYASTTTPNVTYAYDANSNRTSMVDGTGTTSYIYDELNRMLSVTSPGPKTIGYRYDRNGNRVKLIYPDNTAVNYTFDAVDRMATVVDWANRATTYNYNIDSSMLRVDNINGTSANYTYDNAQRLTQLWNKSGTNTITRHTYTMDKVGNRTHTDEVLKEGFDPGPISSGDMGYIDYTYDRLYRLLRENRRLPAQTEEDILYTYDSVGNRIRKLSYNPPGTPLPDDTAYTYDRADRITAVTGDESTGIQVDANGNTTTYGDSLYTQYTYDQANRLLMEASSSYKNVYDGDGNRTKVIKDPTKWYASTYDTFVYDVNRSLPVVLQDSSMKYVWGLNLIYAQDVSGSATDGDIRVYHYDGLGSMRSITDNDTPLRTSTYQDYDAFGVKGYSNREIGEHFNFVGEHEDRETGFVYLRARFYNPVLGRFMSRDPFAGVGTNPQSLNRYSYVENNPVNAVDPSGLSSSRVLNDMLMRNLGTTSTSASSARFVPGVNRPYADLYYLGGMVVVGVSVITLGAPEGAAAAGVGIYEGGNTVYWAIVNGVPTYVGITNDFTRRAYEHAVTKGIDIQKISGLESLSRVDARAVEQVLIERFGLSNLLNQINSISPSNPVYQDALQRGTEILKAVGR